MGCRCKNRVRLCTGARVLRDTCVHVHVKTRGQPWLSIPSALVSSPLLLFVISLRICAVLFQFSWTGTRQGSLGLQSRPWGLSLSAWEIGPRKTEKQPPHLRTHEPESITTAFYPPPPDHAGSCTVPAPMGGETKGRRLFSQHLTPAGFSLVVFICSPEFLDF